MKKRGKYTQMSEKLNPNQTQDIPSPLQPAFLLPWKAVDIAIVITPLHCGRFYNFAFNGK